jgi:SAM-dependent methyltransferase
MHAPVMNWMSEMLDELPPFERVLEIGSYDVNGSVRPLFGECDYTGIDVRGGPGVDVVADGAKYEADEPLDAVVCCEVLEHAENAADIVANAYRLLKRRGYFLATMAGPERVPHSNDGHANLGDEYYRNVAPDTLREWLEPFAEVELYEYPERGDLYVVARKG